LAARQSARIEADAGVGGGDAYERRGALAFKDHRHPNLSTLVNVAALLRRFPSSTQMRTESQP
jgi:hypothetical protein